MRRPLSWRRVLASVAYFAALAAIGLAIGALIVAVFPFAGDA